MTTTLLVTVGGSHQPVLAAIESSRPDYVVFLCSHDEGGAPGSHVQVEGKGKVLRSAGVLNPDLPNIPTLAGLQTGRWEVALVPADDLEGAYVGALAALRQHEGDGIRLVADYTGGTKTMTAALVLAVIDHGRCELSLVRGTRTNLVQVLDGTEFGQAVRMTEIRAARQFDLAAGRIAGYDYAGALAVLDPLSAMTLSPATQEERARWVALCRAFLAWDRFDHAGAHRLLRPVKRYAVASWRMLDGIVSRGDPWLLAADLLFNAERRAARARFDDAAARVYRALEMLAQKRLRVTHGITTGDVDLGLIPEPIRPALARYEVEGRVRLPLFASWALLESLGDPVAAPWLEENRGAVLRFLKVRNGSILAHGDTPVSRRDYAECAEPVVTACRDLLERLSAGNAACQFPQAWRDAARNEGTR